MRFIPAVFFFALALLPRSCPAADPPRVATLLLIPFEINSTTSVEALSKMVRGDLRSAFSKQGNLVLLEKEVRRAKRLSDKDINDLAQETGASFVVSGSLTELGGGYSLDARLFNSIEGRSSPPVFMVAEGHEELSAALGKLAERLGREMSDSWSRMPREKIAAFFKGREPARPARAPAKEVTRGRSVSQLPTLPKPPPKAPAEEGARGRVKVALLPFKINSRQGGAELRGKLWRNLSRHLMKGEQVAIVGVELAQRLLRDREGIDFNEEVIRKLAQDSQSEYLIFGSLTQFGENISLDSSVFHNVDGAPFSLSKVYVEGRGALSKRVEELAFELKRRMLKGQIIVTPLEEETPVARGPVEAPKPKVQPKEAAPKPVGKPPAKVAAAPTPERGSAQARREEGSGLGFVIKKSSSPIAISAKMLEADNRARRVTFRGDVVVKKDDITMTSDVVIASYGGATRQISRIVAEGHVKIVQGDMVATSGKAVYYNIEEKFVLTKGPRVVQGKNVVTGEKITVFMTEDRMVVEGGEEQRVKVTIFPEGEKR